jgi:uncharacterized protein (TIGR03437 family)
MKLVVICVLAFLLLFPAFLPAQGFDGPMVRFSTSLGDMDVVLLPQYAPLTVANFMNYVSRGAYNNSFFHRSVAGFVIQGGGFAWQNGQPQAIPQDPPVRNEFRVSNTRRTIAMAKLGGDPNSATNQWFFNLGNNADTLNTQNGGFTVFGYIRSSDTASVEVLDRISSVPTYNIGSPYEEIPLVNYVGGAAQEQNLVLVKSIIPLPTILGVISASAFGGAPSAAPGSFIEIYGHALGKDPGRGWQGSDFHNGNAPTSLDGLTVTVDGKPAYVAYAGPGQVNVQIPAGVATQGSVPVVVTRDGLVGTSFSLPMKPLAPALLAPDSFVVAGKRYVAAFRGSDLISNGSIPGLPAAPAIPGETLVFYGVGFGPVSPEGAPLAGRIPEGHTTVVSPVEFRFGNATGQVEYSGFAPGLVGVYQFNVVLPSNVDRGDVQVHVTVAGQALPQTLWLPVATN